MNMSFITGKNILLTGGAGFLGRYINTELELLSPNVIRIPRSKDCDLRVKSNCENVVQNIDTIIHLAATVGGIGFNRDHPAELFYNNIIMGIHLMEEARIAGVEKFVIVGTVCAYPKYTPVPFKEEDLWDGYPEETNAPYGLAKKILLVQSQAYRQQYNFNSISILPVNLYGPGDNFHAQNSHVIPALIRKFLHAIRENENEVVIWGTGNASREFLFVEDAARGIVTATENYHKPYPVNLGSGSELKIKNLVEIIAELTSYQGDIIWDATMPDGQPRRCLNVERAKNEFGFKATTDLRTGLKKTIEWYKSHMSSGTI